jgi:hypothetical protein
LGVGVQYFIQLGGDAAFDMLLFGVVYWPDAISRWMRQRNSIRFCGNLGKNVMKTMAIIRQ